MLVQSTKIEKVSINFCVNAFSEMVASLHVLSDPSHHTYLKEWNERVNKILEPDLLKSIQSVGLQYSDWSLILDLVVPETVSKEWSSEEAFINDIFAFPDEEFAYYFFAELIKRKDIQKIIEAGTIDKTDIDLRLVKKYLSGSDIEYFFQNLKKEKERIKNILIRYWIDFFSEEWKRIRKYEEESFIPDKKKININGWKRYISSLHEDIFVQDDKIIFNKRENVYTVDLSKTENIFIFPTVFLEPHLMLVERENLLVVFRNLRYQRYEKDDLFRRIEKVTKALASDARLQMIIILDDGDKTPKEMARSLHLTQSTISIHLNVLKDANLVNSYRSGNNVYYNLNTEKLTAFINDFSLLTGHN